MDYHYNAFISYNHNERDIRIARHIQQKLEHYHLPHGLGTAGGLRKIDRIFRDTGELEVSGDLNEEIEKALRNCDYLIVICSPEGRQSVWVQKEISFFLSSHSRKRVLTVLTEGEPLEVIPEILLYEETENNFQEGPDRAEGAGRRILEPLSCDYRGSRRKADREELPRLAAALLGCRYDELVRRKRQYVLTRMIALLSVLAVSLTAVLVYYIWSSNQIKRNYNEALLNESRYLTREAVQDLEKGDAVSAIRKMQEALPGKETPNEYSSTTRIRPLYPEAQRQLTKALHLYETGASWAGAGSLEAAAMYKPPEKLQGIFPDTAGEYLIGFGYTYIYIWNTETDNLVQTIKLEESPKLCNNGLLLKNRRLIVCYSHKVLCYEYDTGKLCWSASIPQTICAGRISTQDRDHLYLLADDLFYILDTEKGDLVSRKRLLIEEGESITDLLQISQDLSAIIFLTHKGGEQINQEQNQLDISILRAYDPIRDETYVLDRTDEGFFYDIQIRSFPKKGPCVLYLKSDKQGNNYQYEAAGYSFRKKKQLWHQLYSYERMQTGTEMKREVRLFDPSNVSSYKDEILLYRDKQLFYLKAASGKTRTGISLEGYPVRLLADSNQLMVLTEEGDVYWIDSEMPRLSALVSFPRSWKNAVKLEGKSVYYCLQADNTLRKYAPKRFDDTWTEMEGYTDTGYVKGSMYNEDWTAWQTYTGFQWVKDGAGQICSVTNEELLAKAGADDTYHNLLPLYLDDHFLHLLDYYANSDYIKQLQNYMCRELVLDLENGNVIPVPVFQTNGYLDDDHVLFCKDILTVFVKGRSGLLYAVDLRNNQMRRVMLQKGADNAYNTKMVISQDGNKVMQLDADRLSISICDLRDGSLTGTIRLQPFSRESITRMSSSMLLYTGFALDDLWNGTFLALPDGNQIHLYNAKCEETDCIPYGEYRLSAEQEMPAVHFSSEGRYLFLAVGETMLRYDLRLGKVNASMLLPADTGSTENAVQWLGEIRENGNQSALYMMMGNTLCKVNQDDDTMGMALEIANVKLYNPLNGCIYTEEYRKKKSGGDPCFCLACFHQRSLEETLEIAKHHTGEDR